ncbi:MAG: N-acetyl-gamma-glutamyl-phosphate reductase [Actinomycetota bacterium]|nr:N-acetyl-gamma-glutamyl-phosphate reductase [Actinomycetota bacterium]
MRVGVIGASGYAGGEVLRLIAGHPGLELAVATADSSAGKPVAEVHQNLAGQAGIGDLTFAPHEAAAPAGCDLAFLALPAGASAAAAASLGEAVKIVDIGPDFRLADPAAWERHYPGPHAGRWVTGLPELPGARARVRAATRVAAPGCYATASILALAPLVGAGLVVPEDIVIVAESGTSGAGRSLRANLLASEVMGSVSAYQVGGLHRHIPEIEQALSEVAAGLTGWGADAPGADPADAAGTGGTPDGARVCFTPVLAPMPRGILATCTARLAAPGTGTADLRAALTAAYAGEPFVTVLPEGRWPATAAVAGSNGVQVQVTADVRSGRAVVVAAIDNLGKGAAGQAVQNANLMLGLPETAGLTAMGVAP